MSLLLIEDRIALFALLRELKRQPGFLEEFSGLWLPEVEVAQPLAWPEAFIVALLLRIEV